jgi:AraC-like DNA-binding protein
LIIITGENKIWLSLTEGLVSDLMLNLQVLFYMMYALLEVRKYRKQIREFYSSITGLYYSWLAVVLYGFFFMWLIDFVHFMLDKLIGLPPIVNSMSTTISLSINFVFAILVFYKGLTHPEFFNSDIKEEKPKYEKSKLTKEDADIYLEKLQNFMLREKPYLIPNININDLSAKADIPMRFLSQIINDSLNKNFFDFINYYRIEESKNYLTDPKYKKRNILEILYEVGFNSKATFNKVFKDYTGQTPTEYRQRHLS